MAHQTGNAHPAQRPSSGSFSAIKKLGKKMLPGRGHLDDGSDSSGGSKSDLHHGARPKSSSPGSRQRSSSLLQRNKSSANVGQSNVRSSASVHNMVAHNHNPFAHASDVLGTGTGIASPRGNSGTNHSLHRKGSSNFPNHLLSNENIIYNPYGMNSPNGGPGGSRPGSAYAGNSNNSDLSFYMHDGNSKIRMLPLPIADPNTYLPEEMKQTSVHLTDNFIFDSENKTLGSGGSSEVRKVRSAYKQKDVYALKKLNMIYDESAEKFYKRCSKEFIIAKHLSRNIHVANTYYLVKVPTTTYTTRGWGFIMEICVRDLFQMMERSGWKSVSLSEKFCLFKQVAQGVKFCHDNGIAHRDLKPENVLMSKDGVCKLTDFGISDWYHVEPQNFDSPVRRCEGMIGSPPYTPPEVMLHDAKKHYPESMQKPYDPLKMDSYALGMILMALVNNMLPFFESCNTDSRFRDYETSYENYINHQNPHFREKGCHKAGPGAEYSLAKNFKSTEASRVAWRLADPNPETRYTMDDLYTDPWFQSVETCVEPDDEYFFKSPVIKRTSSESGSGFYISEPTSKEDVSEKNSDKNLDASTVSHTSNPFMNSKPKPKPRSMVDIAQSHGQSHAVSHAVYKAEVAAKVPSRVAEEADGTEQREEPSQRDEPLPSVNEAAARDGAQSEQPPSGPRSEPRSEPQPEAAQPEGAQNEEPASEEAPSQPQASSAATAAEEPASKEASEDPQIRDLSLHARSSSASLAAAAANEPAPDAPAPLRHGSSASLRSSSSASRPRRKRPVHNHMDLPTSLKSPASTRSFS